MHIITIACAPVALQFVYKTKESATAAWETRADETGKVTLADDFGQTGSFTASAISCRVLEDCDVSRQAHIARSLHQQRMQNDAQKAAEADPALRMGLMRSPAVLSPMAGFNGRGN
jgi:hypothetical protein